jgi:iron complex outermembrane receptor protein
MTLLAGAALLAPTPGWAQSAPAPADAPPASPAQPQPNAPAPAPAPAASPTQGNGAPEGQIVITGLRRNREDVLSGTSVLSSQALTRELRPTIGETLSRQPGVSATSFGPNASRPVLRGFQGERVRVLTDGIGSLDASNLSADHAVAINPLTAERIEVLRGPAALLFGSEAIGGVVNVIDTRIPRRMPDGVHIDGLATYGSAANQRAGNASIDVPAGSRFVVHADANYSKSDDLRIGGFVLSPELRARAAASADPEIRSLADLRGRLPNTAARTWEAAAGAAWVSNGSHAGASLSHYDSSYGVPIRYNLDPGADQEAPRIHMKQNRADFRSEFHTAGAFVDAVRLRAGYADYRHDELEKDGSIGTTFFSKGFEGRAEILQSVRHGWGGGFGAQFFTRDLNVVGAEKFLPKNKSSQYGLFAIESYDLGAFRAEAGGRFEHADVSADADPQLGNPQLSRRFNLLSGSLGGSYQIARGWRIGVNGSHSERAPSAEELFANGPHGGTQAFEVGDPSLRLEQSWGVEATLHGTGPGYNVAASVYETWFHNYIYEQQTGQIRHELPVFQNLQANARYMGFELDGSVRLATLGSYTLNFDGVADYVRATISQIGPAPRIPPFRLLGGIEAQSSRVTGRIEVERVSRQDRLARLETPTPGYTMVNASVSVKPFGGGNQSSIVLSMNNIFDVDARRHASFLKDYAPLAGRDIRLTARITF